MLLFDIEYTWIYWAEFSVLMLFLLTNISQPHVVRNHWRSLTGQVGRRYEDESVSIAGQLTGYLFGIGTIAIAGAQIVLTQLPALHTTWNRFMLVCLFVVGIDMLKSICIMYLDFTFRWKVPFRVLYKNYLDFRGLICLALFAILLVMPLLSTQISIGLLVVIGVMYLVLMGWKLLSVFPLTGTSVAYLLLYFIHLEIVPAGLMLAGTYKILV